jgi:peroxiredoxin
LQESVREFEQSGIGLVVVSVDAPAVSKGFRDRLKLTFPMLSDTNRATIKIYEVHDVIADIAKPATFVLDGEGVIRWKYVGKGKEDRPPAARLLEEARATLPQAVSARGKLPVVWASLK